MLIPKSDLMSIKTINMKLALYSEMLSWAVDHGLADLNPFKGMQIKDKRSVQNLRLPFTITDCPSASMTIAGPGPGQSKLHLPAESVEPNHASSEMPGKLSDPT